MATDQYGEAQPGPVLQSHLVTIRKLHRLELPFQACHFKRMDPHALFLLPRKKRACSKEKKQGADRLVFPGDKNQGRAKFRVCD